VTEKVVVCKKYRLTFGMAGSLETAGENIDHSAQSSEPTALKLVGPATFDWTVS